jgi:hypothetical protein
MGDRQL